MALALADSIGTAGWDLNDQARRYLDWYENGRYSVTGRCFDIGIQTRSALTAFRRHPDALRSGDTQSSGNGCIMRLAPVPIAFAHCYPDDVELLARRCEESSIPTHASDICRSATRFLGLVLAGLARGEAREVVLAPDWPMLDRLGLLHPAVEAVAHGSYRDHTPPAIRGGGYVVHCLEASLWAFHDARDFREAVLRGVNLGDDADTTGAVCGQLGGACWGESGIPEEWRRGLARPEMIEAVLGPLLERFRRVGDPPPAPTL
jgi:ADP-ribosyl-[dinitrogen reductase] hydrolase